jgi:DNA-binding NtrC family response regulator
VALTSGEVIGVEQLLLGGEAPSPTTATGPAAKSDRSLRQAVHRHISSVLHEVGGNKRRAARELGVSRATLERKLQEMAKASRR